MNVFDSIRWRVAAILFVFGGSAFSALGGTNVVVWDTMKGGRDEWRKVPSNLMELEKDPLKSASDPGYYGRDYNFTGDVVIENNSFTATFSRDFGSVTLQMKEPAFFCAGQIVTKGRTAAPIRFELIKNAADEVVVNADYGKGDAVLYAFGRNEIIEVKPSGGLKTVTLSSPLQYVIAPSFVGDDLIFKPEAGVTNRFAIPAENMLIGLMGGEKKGEIVLTWPGKHTVTLSEDGHSENPYFRQTTIETEGESVFVTVLSAPGIWHREKLTAEFLEKDKAIDWKPPFMARWQTQLVEGNVKTTYAFRHAKGTVWRGVAGSYNYPVWFDGATANFSLSKKVPPKSEALIYFLEGEDTPTGVLTPVDVLKATLGRPAAAKILDVEGRKLRTHHGDSGSNVHRACTCGYTEAIQAVFEKGEECDKKEFVDQSIQDMIYFVKRHLERIDEYRAFATNLSEYLQATVKSNPALKEYLEDLEATAQQIPAEYENQKENMKSLDYAAELEKKTIALTGKKDSENLKRYMELLKLWRGMGGSQDGVVAQYHILARKIFQDAGYNCVGVKDEKAAEVAREIRARCKEILRNPDGYEIWANY
jgi:hypothetical protein